MLVIRKRSGSRLCNLAMSRSFAIRNSYFSKVIVSEDRKGTSKSDEAGSRTGRHHQVTWVRFRNFDAAGPSGSRTYRPMVGGSHSRPRYRPTVALSPPHPNDAATDSRGDPHRHRSCHTNQRVVGCLAEARWL